MDTKCWQTSSQFDIFDFGIDFRSALQSLVVAEDFLLDSIGSNVGLRQEFFQAAKEKKQDL